MKLLNNIIVAVAFLSGSFALAEEGFYRPDQVAASPAAGVSGASLLVEQWKGGQWKHIGNAFFVSSKGIALTNGHIASSCLYSNRARIDQEFGNIFGLYRKGFVAEKGKGLGCPMLRATANPQSGKFYALELAALAPIAEQEDAPSPQQGLGPHYDFAALRVLGSAEESFPFYPLQSADASELAPGNEVFMFGFPAKTNRQYSELVKAGKYDQVETGDYRVSLGKIEEVASDFFFQPNQGLFLYTSNDGAAGSSGSALLSASGKLLGIIAGSGNPKATMAYGCNARVDYCVGGVSLYIRANHIWDQLEKSFPAFAKEIRE